jgi:ubiquitin-conjugating enzyme E2 Z
LLLSSSPSQSSPPPKATLARIRADIRAVLADPLPGIVVVPDPSSLLLLHALVMGPAGTPYEAGLFVFRFGFPLTYPQDPPKVKLLNTGGGTVRMGPNLYANGKVCLSILGTWSGPSWSPVQTLASVLLSIQSLLNEFPYTNEPGFERASSTSALNDYNDVVAHETLRVAALDVARDARAGRLAGGGCGGEGEGEGEGEEDELRSAVLDAFVAMAEGGTYAQLADARAGRLDGKPFRDPYGDRQGVFRFAELKAAIAAEAARGEGGGGGGHGGGGGSGGGGGGDG